MCGCMMCVMYVMCVCVCVCRANNNNHKYNEREKKDIIHTHMSHTHTHTTHTHTQQTHNTQHTHTHNTHTHTSHIPVSINKCPISVDFPASTWPTITKFSNSFLCVSLISAFNSDSLFILRFFFCDGVNAFTFLVPLRCVRVCGVFVLVVFLVFLCVCVVVGLGLGLGLGLWCLCVCVCVCVCGPPNTGGSCGSY